MERLPHRMPSDLRAMLAASASATKAWENVTPLARNEWYCWVTSFKKPETRERHVRMVVDYLNAGKRRPCCWPGCPHRPGTAAAAFATKRNTSKR